MANSRITSGVPSVAASLLVLALTAGVATAQGTPRAIATGHDLSERNCIQCHQVDPSDHGSWTDAPSFESIANKPGTTPATLSAFIQKLHMKMLNTARPKNEAEAIAAYIISLRKH